MKIVVLDANAYWTEQLFRQCGRFADVLLLKPRGFRAHRQLCGTWKSHAKPLQVGERVWEQCLSMPPGWMFGLWPFARHKLQRVIRQFARSEPVTLVLNFPQYRSMIPALKPALSAYYNFDDYRDNWPKHSGDIPRWEAELVEMAGLTICIADHRAGLLREQHPAKAAKIFHLPLGCTPEFMANSETGDRRPETGDRKVAGYIGALNYRFDFAFLADVAVRLPNVKFVLGGRVREDGDAAWRAGLERVRTLPNVSFPGWVDHAKLGEQLIGFDVLLMPYARCNFNTNACPAKLWDYLGTGKPIVANDANPETLLWREVVRIGATPEAFAAAIQEVLHGEPALLSARRLQIARDHTWEKLAGRLQTMLTGG
jgi:glycosyltransferase involved in cell wall biosynthesis